MSNLISEELLTLASAATPRNSGSWLYAGSLNRLSVSLGQSIEGVQLPIDLEPTQAYMTNTVSAPLYTTIIFIANSTLQSFKMPSINLENVRAIEAYGSLKDNWDEDGALAPSQETINKSIDLANALSSSGQDIANFGPGPSGEIMIEIRNADESRSIEIISYPQHTNVVKFFNHGGTQEKLNSIDETKLSQLLSWLNG